MPKTWLLAITDKNSKSIIRAIIVRAETEDRARAIASAANVGPVNHWLDRRQSSCTNLTYEDAVVLQGW